MKTQPDPEMIAKYPEAWAAAQSARDPECAFYQGLQHSTSDARDRISTHIHWLGLAVQPPGCDTTEQYTIDYLDADEDPHALTVCGRGGEHRKNDHDWVEARFLESHPDCRVIEVTYC